MKVAKEVLQELIEATHFHTPFGTCETLCTIVLKNGFSITGRSACINKDEFSSSIGADKAYDNALDILGSFEAYSTASRLHAARLADEAALAAGVTAENVKAKAPRKPRKPKAEPEQGKPDSGKLTVEAFKSTAVVEEVAPAKPRRQRKAA